MAESTAEEFIRQRKEYYTEKAKEFFAPYPHHFESFVKDPCIVKEGNELLVNRMATAYNFATNIQFPVVGTEPYIFYNNYVQRAGHFGEMLERMETERVLKEDDVSFGIKATKVFGNWGDREAIVRKLTLADGEVAETSESVEGIVIFHPHSSKQAIEIGKFLLSRARKSGSPHEIEESWTVPDSRARKQLQEILETIGFKEAVANIFKFPAGNIIALRQEYHFCEKGWEGYPILVNSELYEFLNDYKVGP